ncbi:MAG: hypothetical protein HRU20_07770 [Pseudomonadales bacterium]|nr:hypothetical protein [Pseudomonadales bacterium]
MKRVVQQDDTGCGLACVAMLAGKSYRSVKKVAIDKYDLECDGHLYTGTTALVNLGREYGVDIGVKRRKFKGFENLPDRAILAINYREKDGNWHWVVFQRKNGQEFVLDPKVSIKKDKRTDLSRIANSTTHWLPVKYA